LSQQEELHGNRLGGVRRVMPTRDLTSLFAPASVAIIGASNDESKYGNWLSAQALRSRDVRRVHLVNRGGQHVLGVPTLRQLKGEVESIDLAVVAVPAHAFEAAVEDALAVGARAIVGITAGFAELGEAGAAQEAQVSRRIRDAGAVLLGPNCLGVLDNSSKLYLTSNAMPTGSIGLISQSGNVALELSLFLEERGAGFSRFASLGNQADITVADLLDSYAAHDETEVIALYCEDFRDGRAFVAAAARAVELGKPVVLLTVGASAASQRGAKSHTGALTSGSTVIDAACAAAGIDRVYTIREMADLLSVLDSRASSPARRVAVVADGGGHASLASDVAEASGLEVVEFPASLKAALRAILPPSAGVSNPVDLAGAGEQDITSFSRVLDLVLAEPTVDSVMVTGYFGGYGLYGDSLSAAEIQTAHDMAHIITAREKPAVVHTMQTTSRAAQALQSHGVPVYRAVEDAARSLGSRARRAKHQRPSVTPLPAPAPLLTDDSYWASRELLRGREAQPAAAQLVTDPREAAAAADQIGYPVVIKALGLLHKSDAGGVRLGLSNPMEVRAAVQDMQDRLAPPGFCVERMGDTTDGVELIVGVQWDERFGPVAMVGLGGVFIEVLGDVAFALAPLSAGQALELLKGLKAAPLLLGARGRKPVNLEAAAAAVAAVTAIAASHPEIREIEVNPLLVTPAQCIGLDARVLLA
jgi:acyl-CoA synthetase (NDP forming)